MGTGSEREHGIFSEKAPPLGACPPFQRRGGGPAQKMGLTTVANCVFPDFSQEATEPVPFFGLPCLQFEFITLGSRQSSGWNSLLLMQLL